MSNPGSSPRIVIIIRRIGPYHVSRMEALAERLGKDHVVVIEITENDEVYDWQRVAANRDFQRHTLFTESDGTHTNKALWQRLQPQLAAINPDIVVIPGWSDPAALVALSWSCEHNIPVIMFSDSTSADAKRYFWREQIKRRIISLADAMLVAGKRHVEYATSLGMPVENIQTGYDVVDNAYFKSRSEDALHQARTLRIKYNLPEHYFLVVSRFVEKKNLLRLLEAYADYRQKSGSGVRSLVLAGSGPLQDRIENKIKELSLEDAVHLAGFVQYDDLPVFYALAGAFILASTVDQWGLVVNEAMASGLPVLVSERCGCAPDLVEHGSNGFVFDPFDISALSGLMLKVASMDDNNREAMGRAGQARIEAWSPRLFADNMLKLMKGLQPRKRAGVIDKLLLRVLMVIGD